MAESSESGGLIVFNGAMVDVGSMMTKLDKSEKAREEIEQKLIMLDAKMGTIPQRDGILCVCQWIYVLVSQATLCSRSLLTIAICGDSESSQICIRSINRYNILSKLQATLCARRPSGWCLAQFEFC